MSYGEIVQTIGQLEGVPLVLTIAPERVEKLNKQHFKGKGVAVASNFHVWNSLHACVSDPVVQTFLETSAQRLLDADQHSGEFQCHEVMPYPRCGWVGAASLRQFKGRDLRLDTLSSGAKVFRVRHGRNTVLAPVAHELTFSFRLNIEPDNRSWILILFSVAPGPYIGRHEGFISQEHGVAFFHWDHPGEPMEE